jgi:hypothetical protein
MTEVQAKELKGLLDSLKKSVDTLRKVEQSNTDFVISKLDDLIDRIDIFLRSLG